MKSDAPLTEGRCNLSRVIGALKWHLGITAGNLKGFLMLMLQLISKSYDIELFRKIEGNKIRVNFFVTESPNSLSKKFHQ